MATQPFTEWAVEKATTDKLEGLLNSVSAAGREIDQITFIGGRDWTVISFREVTDGELLQRSQA